MTRPGNAPVETPARPPFVRRRLSDIDGRFGDTVRLVRKDMGITAFGAQAFDLPPGARTPFHDEAGSGQEELYVHLGGQGWLEVEGERVLLDDETLVFVPPGVRRRAIAGSSGVRYLCVGAPPAGGYRPPEKFA